MKLQVINAKNVTVCRLINVRTVSSSCIEEVSASGMRFVEFCMELRTLKKISKTCLSETIALLEVRQHLSHPLNQLLMRVF